MSLPKPYKHWPDTPPVPKQLKPAKANPQLIRRAWAVGLILLVATLALQFAIHPHGNFGLDARPFFYAWFGFVACGGIIIVSKLLGVLLKRKEDYYTKDENGDLG